MSEKHARPLAEMLAVAVALRDELAPYCERCEIAGSIRRRKSECSDVELLAVPRFHVERDGLFGSKRINLLDEYAQRQVDLGRWQHRYSIVGTKAFGERFKRVLVDGVPLDLFSCLPPAQFGVLFLIRTGPAEFSRRVVTGAAGGGWMPEGWRVKDGAVYAGGNGVATPEEADVFRVLGREYIEPSRRA